MALAIGAAALVLAVIMLLVDPEPLEGLGMSQRQDAESAVYLLTFVAILPGALIYGPRLARAVERGPNGSALSALAALLAAALILGLLAVRLSAEVGLESVSGPLLAVALAWWLLAASLIARARSQRPWLALLELQRAGAVLWTVLALGVFLCLVAVTRRDAIHFVPLLSGDARRAAARDRGPPAPRPDAVRAMGCGRRRARDRAPATGRT